MDIRIEWRPSPKPAPTDADTRWSLVAAAGRGAGVALGELCARYWCAAYAFVRRCGFPPAVAQQTTAGFFAWLAREELRTVRAGNGQRFRGFLLDRLCAARDDAWRDARAMPASTATQGPLPAEILEDRFLAEVGDGDSAEHAYAKSFSHALVARSFERLRIEAQARERLAIYEQLEPFLRAEPDPAEAGKAAKATGLTPAAAGFALRSLRQRLREIVNQEVCDTLADPAELDQEARTLRLDGSR
jgi:RNA polymerase sigma-70 factor (ECF subfamily)